MYATIVAAKQAEFNGNFHNYMTREGYTRASGAPTEYMIKVGTSKRWRRVYFICRSNSVTYYVTIKGQFKPVCIWDVQSRL